jgi:carboxypeptidase Taq
MKLPDSYASLLERSRELNLLAGARNVLSWDQETYLPKKGVAFRAEQLAYLGGKMHRLQTDGVVGTWIAKCEDAGLDGLEAAAVREWRWEFDLATKLPSEFVEEESRVSSLAMEAWQSARGKSDFAEFRPHLEKLVDLSRRKADFFGYEACAYDALLDCYERGSTSAGLVETFSALRASLAEIGPLAWERSASVPADLLHGHYPVAAQQAFNAEVAAAFGFDFEAGRIDTTAHPFCSGIAPGDTRLTTRYDEADFMSSLYGVLHEVGHGLYEQGLPKDENGAPVTESVSLGIHESQSRLWENHVGRSPEFWAVWYDRACVHFEDLRKHSVEDVMRAVLRSERTFIRVEADEVTYDAHIILRFEIERRLISGELAVADVPEAWNAEFEAMFGLKVDKDSNGCLQDIHWSMGGFGYFPTYTQGNINAAQLMNAARPHIGDGLKVGNYEALLTWLRENVHQHGRRYLPNELMQRATGEAPNAKYHCEHLRKTYT